MTSKGRNAVRLETEIEKCREESRWNRVIELAEQLKQRSPNQETLADFLLGEGKLESYLEENPSIDSNVARARNSLNDAKNHLLNATTELGKKERVALDGNLLLGKLHYICGRFNEALVCYANAELDSLTEKELPSRGLKIVAESYAIKGLCLEKINPSVSSKYKQAEHLEQITKCFELAADLTLLYLQELDKVQQQPHHTSAASSGK
ncbi:hypothetical protein RUM43_013801 [Polyplax serrata]|uniref:Tetratricopeptide repeat protein 7 N-terminal domain-containing protein n=1 Tax=Polyplax serrata TaxID=468196 RepID=A0AAN8S671_POLSC